MPWEMFGRLGIRYIAPDTIAWRTQLHLTPALYQLSYNVTLSYFKFPCWYLKCKQSCISGSTMVQYEIVTHFKSRFCLQILRFLYLYLQLRLIKTHRNTLQTSMLVKTTRTTSAESFPPSRSRLTDLQTTLDKVRHWLFYDQSVHTI